MMSLLRLSRDDNTTHKLKENKTVSPEHNFYNKDLKPFTIKGTYNLSSKYNHSNIAIRETSNEYESNKGNK